MFAQCRDETWEVAMHRALDSKSGWTVWDGKVLLAGASKAYKQPITIEEGDPIPLNETRAWFAEGGSDTWFNIPLGTIEVENETGIFIKGSLYSTRMPRGIDLNPNEPMSDAPAHERYKKQGKTDKVRFIEKVKDFGITHAVVLVEDEEMEKVQSSTLLQFYKSLGITVHHTPVEDFTVPPLQIEEGNIEALSIALTKGENCLVHCMGGTGRTGTVVIGAVHNLGIKAPVTYCRKHGKSSYLEIAGQESFIESFRKVVTSKMMEQAPALAHKIIFDQLEDLCAENVDGKFDVVEVPPLKTAAAREEESSVHKQIFDWVHSAAKEGQDQSSNAVSVEDFIQQFTELVQQHDINPNAFKHITPENLRALCALFDPSARDSLFTQESVTWSTFEKIMGKRPVLHSKKMAK